MKKLSLAIFLIIGCTSLNIQAKEQMDSSKHFEHKKEMQECDMPPPREHNGDMKPPKEHNGEHKKCKMSKDKKKLKKHFESAFLDCIGKKEGDIIISKSHHGEEIEKKCTLMSVPIK